MALPAAFSAAVSGCRVRREPMPAVRRFLLADAPRLELRHVQKLRRLRARLAEDLPDALLGLRSLLANRRHPLVEFLRRLDEIAHDLPGRRRLRRGNRLLWLLLDESRHLHHLLVSPHATGC